MSSAVDRTLAGAALTARGYPPQRIHAASSVRKANDTPGTKPLRMPKMPCHKTRPTETDSAPKVATLEVQNNKARGPRQKSVKKQPFPHICCATKA